MLPFFHGRSKADLVGHRAPQATILALTLLAITGCGAGSEVKTVPTKTKTQKASIALTPAEEAEEHKNESKVKAEESEAAETVFVCNTNEHEGMIKLFGYNAQSGIKQSESAISQNVSAVDTACQTPPETRWWGWNSSFTEFVGTETVENNGTLPVAVNFASGHETPIDSSESTSGFAAVARHAEAAAFDPQGNVWWLEAVGHETENLVVYKGTEKVTTAKKLLKPAVVLENVIYPGPPWSWHFSQSGAWSVEGSCTDGCEHHPARVSASGVSPLPSRPEPSPYVSGARLEHLVPHTNLSLYGGALSADGKRIFFAVADPHQFSAGRLYVVSASGGEPKLLVPDLPIDVIGDFHVIGVTR